MSKRVYPIIIFIFTVTLLSSCMLLPVEEEPLSPPVIGVYESAAYQFAIVRRETLRDLIDASAQKIPAREDSLSFTVQARITQVYAETGSFVNAGDIIAELDRSDLEKRLEDAVYEMSRLELKRRHAEESYLLSKKYERVSYVDDYAYERGAADVVTRMQILQMDIDKIRERIAERSMISTMDGSVTYIKRVSDGDRSVERERFVTISDTTVSVFAVTGMNAEYFTPGETVQMKISLSEFFDITVADPEELGVYNPSERAAYFALTEIPAEYMSAKYATVRYVKEERADVLCLPYQAINMVGSDKFVYMLNDNIREQVPVVTGLETSTGLVEIISGLEEGDAVILS